MLRCAWHCMQSKERGEMLYEERLEAAERRRLEGNELFKAGQCRDALGKYAVIVFIHWAACGPKSHPSMLLASMHPR